LLYADDIWFYLIDFTDDMAKESQKKNHQNHWSGMFKITHVAGI